MSRGAEITETQKNILQGLMFSENSFFSPFERLGKWYLSEVEVLQNQNTNVGWVNSLPLIELPPLEVWHEPSKNIQIYQTFAGFNYTALNMPELAIYRRDNNIITYQESNGFYFYVLNLLPEHRELFTTNLNLGITINETEI